MSARRKPPRPRGRPRTVAAELSERFYIRCSLEDLEKWRREAARRGLSSGRDSGLGRLARIALDAAAPKPVEALGELLHEGCSEEYRAQRCHLCQRRRDDHRMRHRFEISP